MEMKDKNQRWKSSSKYSKNLLDSSFHRTPNKTDSQGLDKLRLAKMGQGRKSKTYTRRDKALVELRFLAWSAAFVIKVIKTNSLPKSKRKDMSIEDACYLYL